MPLALFILVAAIMPATLLTDAQERRLARTLVCPERLRDDAARIRNTDEFMALYLRLAPGARAGERMALRARILAAKKCDDKTPLQLTYPET